MVEEGASDMAAAAFVNRRIVLHKLLTPFSVFIRGNDPDMFCHGYLGIGNHGRREECVGMVTTGTDDTTDAEKTFTFGSF